MGESHIVVLAFSHLFGKVGSESRIPVADIFGGIVEGVAQVSGATLLHMGIAVVELPGLVSRGRKAGKGQELVWGIKAGEVTHLSKDHGAHAEANTGDCGNGRMQPLHNALDGSLYFRNLPVKFPDEVDSVPEFQRLGRHNRTDRVPGGVPEDESHIPPVMTLEGICQQELQPSQVGTGNLSGPWEFVQEGID